MPENTYTVTFADAHSHTVAFAGIAAANKIDAVLTATETASQLVSALTASDTWTITVTQP
jgi:hypothetical protein